MVKSASVSVEVRYPSSSGPFLGTTFVSIQPMPTDTSFSHAVPTDSTQAPATVMLVVDLGTWKMDLVLSSPCSLTWLRSIDSED
jgi:hypothetical protein